MSAMQALIAGSLWRDPTARQSKAGKQFVTSLFKAGTPTETLWVNCVAFDTAAQSELLRLKAGDLVSVQGAAKITVFEKSGAHRASLEVVLALRRPPKPRQQRPDAW